MKRSILWLLSIVCGASALAQTGSIEGTIVQEGTSESLPGVNVYLERTAYGSVTDVNGRYNIQNVPEGVYTLVASCVGFLTARQEVRVEAGVTAQINFRIEETAAALDEIVVMVKGLQGLKDIPGSVQYISPKEIQKFSYTDINRVLRAVPGVNLQEEDGYGLRPNIGLRGTGVERSSKITLMEDGILMAPAPYAEPAAYYFPTIGRMHGVEILKGSSQVRYGPSTTGGAINLISTPLPATFSGRVHLWGGSFGGRNLHAYAGNTHERFAYIAETFQYGADGFKQLDGGGDTGFDKKDYLFKFRVNTGHSAKIYQSLTIKTGQAEEKSNETYLGLSEADFRENPYRRYAASQKDFMHTSQTQVSLTHLVRFSKTSTLTTVAYRSDFSRNWYKTDKVKDRTGKTTGIADVLDNPELFSPAYQILTGASSDNSGILFVRSNNRSYYARGIQSVWSFQLKRPKINHDLQLGFRFHQDQVDRFQHDDEYTIPKGVMQLAKSGTPGSESNRVKSANAWAGYAQYKLKSGKFTVIPGLRYENIRMEEKNYGKSDPERAAAALIQNTNHVQVFIPGIGIDYQHNRYMSIFAGIHKGFSPPGPLDETEPEQSVNYETGLRYYKNALSWQITGFFNDYSNLLGSDLAASGGSGTGDLFNAGEVQTKGLEFQLGFDLLSVVGENALRIPLSLSYTYTDAIFKNSFISTFEDWGNVLAGDQFPYLARHQFALLLGVENRKFSADLSGRFMDRMRAVPGQGSIPANEKLDSWFVLDAGAMYRISPIVSLFANGTNLTNAAYAVARRPAGLRPGMPRSFNIGIKADF